MTAPTIVLPYHLHSEHRKVSRSLLKSLRDFPRFSGFLELLSNLSQSLEILEANNQSLKSELSSLRDDLEVSRLQVKSLMEEVQDLNCELKDSHAVLESAMNQNSSCLDLIKALTEES